MKDYDLQTLKWDLRWLELSELVSKWSKDESTKVGSVIAHNKELVSIGYNGFPSKIADDDRLKDRETKYKIIRHAEENAVKHKNRKNLSGCTIYTFPFMPCSRCACLIIDENISRVVSYKSKISRWESDFEFSRGLLNEAGIMLIEYERN